MYIVDVGDQDQTSYTMACWFIHVHVHVGVTTVLPMSQSSQWLAIPRRQHRVYLNLAWHTLLCDTVRWWCQHMLYLEKKTQKTDWLWCIIALVQVVQQFVPNMSARLADSKISNINKVQSTTATCKKKLVSASWAELVESMYKSNQNWVGVAKH